MSASSHPALFELVTDVEAPPSVEAVVPDPSGHIGFIDPEEQPNPYAAFFDTGSGLLSLWSGQGFSLNPAMARDLAFALHAWADKHDEQLQSKFGGDLHTSLAWHAQVTSELQLRVVRARRYAARHSVAPELLEILEGSVVGEGN